MKPIKLVMSAFGSYASKVEIDFTKLNDGVFLLTGDTGAGKTTIFDAITFALYGKASGVTRDDSKMFRSQYAKKDDDTYVEFTFVYKDKEYFIRRNPEYMKPKKRGEGFTAKKQEAELHFPDGERVVTKVLEVNNAVENLLGVTYEQFRQIVMIAQGDFQKLLLASTDERAEIFRKIFNTYIYKDIEEKLKERESNCKAEYDSKKKSIVKDFDSIEGFDKESDKLEFEQYKKDGYEGCYEKVLDILNGLIDSENDKYNDIQNEEKVCNESLQKIVLSIEKADNIIKTKNEFEKRSEQLVTLDEQRKNAFDKKEKSKDNNLICDKLKEEINNDNKRLETIVEYEKLQNETKACSEKLINYKTNLESMKKQNEKLQLEIEDNKKELEILDDVERKIDSLSNEKKALSEKEDFFANNKNEIKILTDKIENVNDSFEKNQKKLLELEKNIADNGEVLGSCKDFEAKKGEVKHALDDITKRISEIENSKDAYKESFKQILDIKKKVNKNSAMLENMQKEVENNEKFLIENENIKSREIDIANAIDNNADKLKRLETIKISIQSIENKRKDILLSQKEYIKVCDEFEVVKEKYDTLYKVFLDNQAGILASQLEDNTPCPVCGSLSHPRLANMVDTAPTKESVDIARSQYDNANKSCVKLSSLCHEKKEACVEDMRILKTSIFNEYDKYVIEYNEKVSTKDELNKDVLNQEVVINEIGDYEKYIKVYVDVHNYIKQVLLEESDSLIKEQKKLTKTIEKYETTKKNNDKVKIQIDKLSEKKQGEVGCFNQMVGSYVEKKKTISALLGMDKDVDVDINSFDEENEKSIYDICMDKIDNLLKDYGKRKKEVFRQQEDIDSMEKKYIRANKDKEKNENELKEKTSEKSSIMSTRAVLISKWYDAQRQCKKLAFIDDAIWKECLINKKYIGFDDDSLTEDKKFEIFFDKEASVNNSEIVGIVLSFLQIKKKELDMYISDVLKKKQRKDELNKIIPSKQDEYENKNKEINSIINEITRIETEFAHKNDELNKLKLEIKDVSKEQLVENINKKKEDINVYTEQKKKDELEYADVDKQYYSCKEIIEGLKKDLTSANDIDKEELLAKKESILTKQREISDMKNKYYALLHRNKEILDKVTQNKEQLIDCEKRYTMVRTLSDTAKGNVSNKARIRLETYYQMAFFDRVLLRANRRLLTMSKNQYELKREENSENKRSQIGLNISIIDHYNGSIRSVKTLSGGEAFEASLSLALGLSDEIQENAGGICMEAMFVDEGFGSLDEESLNKAISALTGLASNHHMIGIISHVSELKERIDKKIIVTKSNSGDNIGSKIEIVL